MSELDFWSGTEIAGAIRTRSLSAREVMTSTLASIANRNETVGAFVYVDEQQAMDSAALADEQVARGEKIGSLHGVPLAVKDLFDFKAGMPATLGSKVFRDQVPDETCLYVQRLEACGAIVVGKTNTPELGFKGTTDNALFGVTRNPFDLSTNSGGSSGGSAAAVAEGLVPLSQGSDGGGSIRIPAAICGTYGLKPSFGRVSNITYPNLFTKTSPFLHPGPITRTVEDSAVMLDAMSGPHDLDPFSLPAEHSSFISTLGAGVAGLQIAYTPDFGDFPVEDSVASCVESAMDAFGECGASVVRIALELPYSQTELAALWHRLIGRTYVDFVEDCAQLGIDLLGDHSGDIDPDLLPLIEAALCMSPRDVSRDAIMRSKVFEVVQGAFRKFPLIVSPVTCIESIPNSILGRTIGPDEVRGVGVDSLIGWCLTYVYNFTGHPAASVPAGLSSAGRPIGMQIAGASGRDDLVLRASRAFEEVRPWSHTYRSRRGIA